MVESLPGDSAPDSTPTPPGDDSAAQAELEVAKSPEASSGSMSRYVLLVLFGLTMLGLGYDQLARHEARSACELVESAIEHQSRADRLKPEGVRQLLSRQPDATLSDETSEREIYRWRGTLLSYDLTVEYSKEGDLRDVRLGDQ